MGEVSTVGLDIAKSVFQVHGVDGGIDPQARGSREGVGVLLGPTALPDRYRGLSDSASLESEASGTRSHG
jgi:hypothetical protein